MASTRVYQEAVSHSPHGWWAVWKAVSLHHIPELVWSLEHCWWWDGCSLSVLAFVTGPLKYSLYYHYHFIHGLIGSVSRYLFNLPQRTKSSHSLWCGKRHSWEYSSSTLWCFSYLSFPFSVFFFFFFSSWTMCIKVNWRLLSRWVDL